MGKTKKKMMIIIMIVLHNFVFEIVSFAVFLALHARRQLTILFCRILNNRNFVAGSSTNNCKL